MMLNCWCHYIIISALFIASSIEAYSLKKRNSSVFQIEEIDKNQKNKMNFDEMLPIMTKETETTLKIHEDMDHHFSNISTIHVPPATEVNENGYTNITTSSVELKNLRNIKYTPVTGYLEKRNKTINATEVYRKALNFTKTFLNYMELDPFKFNLFQLKPHYRAVINGMTFIKETSLFIKEHIDVSNREDVHVIYNLLDFYCALQKQRHKHLG
ncbi:unnamed protein product, partial [Meganyctiphanes norvegica]